MLSTSLVSMGIILEVEVPDEVCQPVGCSEAQHDHGHNLSRASGPRVAVPWLRSSYLRYVVSGEVFSLDRRLSWRTGERGVD
jgi:hypothetical protein